MEKLSEEVKWHSLVTDRDNKHGNDTYGQKFQASGSVQDHRANSTKG